MTVCIECTVPWGTRQLPREKKERRGRFRPQPYRQLAQVLRAQGLDGEAKAILIGMAVDRRKWGGLRWWSQGWQWVLWATIGNGYQPIRAGVALIVLWIIGFILFGAAYEAGTMVPTKKEAFGEFMKDGAVRASYEPFCALVYAIDTSLPIISFGQRDKWHPADSGAKIEVIAPPDNNAFDKLVCEASFTRGWSCRMPWLKWIRWIYLAVGWFLTTMFVAGVTGLVGRD